MKKKTVLALLTCATVSASAADAVWIGGNVGRWSDAANWQDGIVPCGSGDSARFELDAKMTAVVVDADIVIGKLLVSGTMLNLYSDKGAKVVFDAYENETEMSVAADAAVRFSGVDVQSPGTVGFTGGGRLIAVGDALSSVHLDLKRGIFESESAECADMAVSSNDGLWVSHSINNQSVEEIDSNPYAGDAGICVGSTDAYKAGAVGRIKPIRIDRRFTLSADVENSGTASYGFALVLHNDPRGALAHTTHASTENFGYAAHSNVLNHVTNGFAFAIYNSYASNRNGAIRWGANGILGSPVTSDPRIYTATRTNNTMKASNKRFKLEAEFDPVLKTATLRLRQDQRELVDGGKSNAEYRVIARGVDLVSLCGSDKAFLSFTFNEGGSTTFSTLSNLKVEYADAVSGTVVVDPSADEWENHRYDSDDAETTSVPVYGTESGSVKVGAAAKNLGSLTVRREKISIDGNMRISGKVTENGSGAIGWAMVLHDDPSGLTAHRKLDKGNNLLYNMKKSFALGFYNHFNNQGKFRCGRNGSWDASFQTTDPAIYFNPKDPSTQDDVRIPKYDFSVTFDQRGETATLRIFQYQDGAPVEFEHIVTGVSLTNLCAAKTAYIAFASTAGGYTTDITVDDLLVEYLDVPETPDVPRLGALAVRGRDITFEASPNAGLCIPMASNTVFESGSRLGVLDGAKVNLGACRADGSFSLGSTRVVTVAGNDNLWTNAVFEGNTDQEAVSSRSSYGVSGGSIRTGFGLPSAGTINARLEKVDVAGDFTISGKVADGGSGAHGFAIVLHNDPRGPLAHGVPATSGGKLSYSDPGTRVANSFAIGFLTHASNNGQIWIGRNGYWLSADKRMTSPLICTAPRGSDPSGDAVRRQYDFSASFNSAARTMTLVLRQSSDGATIACTNVYESVYLPGYVGGDRAYLSLVSESGGYTVDVTIDDFTIEYDATASAEFSADGVVSAVERASLTLDDAVFAVESSGQLPFDRLLIADGAMFSFSGAYAILTRRLSVDGCKVKDGVYTRMNCDWVSGNGQVVVRSFGTAIVIR